MKFTGRMVWWAMLCGAAIVMDSGRADEPSAVRNRLIVHEWGTFTTIAGTDGAALEWRPLAEKSDLPGFVYSIAKPGSGFRPGNNRLGKCNMTAQVRMETPVLYFYADRETEVSVNVNFPKGKITEWYPHARTVNGGWIDWGRIKVLPDATPDLPAESARSHYYPARQTDAAPVRVTGAAGVQHEKFLFYRGVGNFELPLAIALDGDRVRVRNRGEGDIGEIILFENRAGRIGYRMRVPNPAAPENEVTLARPVLDATLDSLLGQLELTLTRQGLYRKEAKAMIETWRDHWFEEGLRAFFVLPRAVTDEVLPIALDPKPAELVRVLVGRVELITPEMEESIRVIVQRLGAPDYRDRETAQAALQQQGRFAEPVLKRELTRTTDPEIKVRIGELLAAAGGEAR